ncbi:YAE1 [Candida pseudojiufengensis]|uniref:YAE1 n=1 Tax=Candida pseudojiufengensis TaxID=497109 RepID=UPI0022247F91|nr:YAE1 [Candida pseudojiufengensis]KAI5960778.1 YAE1 [Candida pseudojiufengensis]
MQNSTGLRKSSETRYIEATDTKDNSNDIFQDMTPSACDGSGIENLTCSCKNSTNMNIKSTSSEQAPLSDDIWESEDEETHKSNERNFVHNDIIRQHRKQGYLDGITYNKETNLQQGFDNSFSNGGQLGIDVGYILAKVKIIDKKVGSNLLTECIEDLRISKIFNDQYFNSELEMINDQHELIEKWQKRLKKLEP